MIDNDKYSIHIQEFVGGYSTKIWIFEKSEKPRIASIDKNGLIKWITIQDEHADFPPTISLNYDLWKVLKRSMLEDKERDKSTVESELNATKYHLEDMRKLVKGLK